MTNDEYKRLYAKVKKDLLKEFTLLAKDGEVSIKVNRRFISFNDINEDNNIGGDDSHLIISLTSEKPSGKLGVFKIKTKKK